MQSTLALHDRTSFEKGWDFTEGCMENDHEACPNPYHKLSSVGVTMCLLSFHLKTETINNSFLF